MRETHIQTGTHPDALSPLAPSLIREAATSLGPQFEGLFEDVTVDNVSDKSGKLRISVRGQQPDSKATFELTDGKWTLIRPK